MLVGEPKTLIGPLYNDGDGPWTAIGLAKSWTLSADESADDLEKSESEADRKTDSEVRPRVRVVLKRRDDLPFVTQHEVGAGRIVTVLAGIDKRWTNWPSDLTFPPFLLLTNATLWSGAAPPTHRTIDQELVRVLPTDKYLPDLVFIPAASEPPRVPVDLTAEAPAPDETSGEIDAGAAPRVNLDPQEMVIAGQANVDELLRPGISEWVLTQANGRGEVIPVASVIQIGEGDLKRVDTAEVQQALLPLNVQFVKSSVWSETNRAAGSSTLTLLLLGLLGLVLAAEQALASWASYHVSPSPILRKA